ncbi:MAG: hypothetical protein WAN34_13875, partial [Acidimicrobiia bacterium]
RILTQIALSKPVKPEPGIAAEAPADRRLFGRDRENAAQVDPSSSDGGLGQSRPAIRAADRRLFAEAVSARVPGSSLEV